MNFIRSGYLLLLCGLCSCVSYYSPPVDGPTATINAINYQAYPAHFFSSLVVYFYDMDNDGCISKSREISELTDIQVPANKLVGLSLSGVNSLDSGDINYTHSCAKDFGITFEEDQEYTIAMLHRQEGCGALVVSTIDLTPVELIEFDSDRAFQHCVDQSSLASFTVRD